MNTMFLLTSELNDITNFVDSVGSSSLGIAALLEIIITIVGSIAGTIGVVGTFIIGVIGAIIGLAVTVGTYLLESVPLFIFAKRAGNKWCWLAFFPILRTYLKGTLPQREFNIFNLIKTNKRGLMTLIYIIGDLLGTYILSMLSVIPAIGQIIGLLNLLMLACLAILEWRIKYDLLKTAGKDEIAMPIAIISAIPGLGILFDIVFLFCCGAEPDYGAGNYHEHSKEYLF